MDALLVRQFRGRKPSDRRAIGPASGEASLVMAAVGLAVVLPGVATARDEASTKDAVTGRAWGRGAAVIRWAFR